jgi:glycosyltransferase involved in cell wall biosynthesis
VAEPGPAPILFTHFGDAAIRGSEQVLLDLFTALDRSRFRPILWCNAALLAERAQALDVVTHETPMQFFQFAGTTPFDLAVWRRQIAIGRALVVRHGARLLHANSAAPVQWLAPLARSLRLPLLVHLHTPYLRRDRFVLLLHQATLAVGVSRPTLEGLAADGMSPTRLRLVPNGIDLARLLHGPAGDLRAQLGIPPDAFVVGSVGSLIPRTGLDVVLAAFARLASPAHLILAGSGPERTSLETLACGLGIAPRVHFLGNTDYPVEVYRAMDVNVLASRREAFGLVIIEAALGGVPSIGSAVDGIPEVIEDGETGLLFPRDDVAALAGTLERFRDDTALRQRLGAAARDRALARFTAARMAANLGTAYDELLALPPSRLGWATLRHTAAPYLRLALRPFRHG